MKAPAEKPITMSRWPCMPRWSCTRLAIARMAAASTAAAGLVGHAEPVPAPIGIVAPALRGIQHDETTGLSGDVEARAEREVLRRLPAPSEARPRGGVSTAGVEGT